MTLLKQSRLFFMKLFKEAYNDNSP